MKTMLTSLIFVVQFSIFSQDMETFIAENAIPVPADLTLDSNHYQVLKPFQTILTGEFHGTLEPALFVRKMTELFLSYGETVSVGIEIPATEMIPFLTNPNDSTLRNSPFFLAKNIDGRNSFAWFNLIKNLYSNPHVHLFFFDNNQQKTSTERDSMMYVNIRNQRIKYPDDRLITLSGNLHNRLVESFGQKTMGSFCYSDTLNFPSEQLLSISHSYSEGTTLNNTGNGLELHEIPYEESDFTRGAPAEQYLLLYRSSEILAEFGIFYTRHVHHSDSL